MSDLKHSIIQIILDAKENNPKKRIIVYLEGGYFDTRFGPQDFSINTLKTAVATAEELIRNTYKITRVLLGILVNDIGAECEEDVCVIPDEANEYKDEKRLVIPDSLKKILKKSHILKDEVFFTREKTLRNRGLKIVKNVIKNPEDYSVVVNEKKNGGELYSVMIHNDKIPLGIKNDKTWSARCPLIMGQYYSDLYIKLVKKFGKDAKILLIDMGEMYDRHKMNNGAKIAFLLLEKMYGYDSPDLEIVNYSFQDDELNNFEYDITK
jgi:hypothetical protein